jgi:phosphatidylserine/phosphatidylglycerophosphate/cardiolipin synthase-like enzyme
MTTYTSIHRIKEIRAEAGGTTGAPLSIKAEQDDGAITEVTLFTDSPSLARRLAEAINDTVKPVEPTEFLLVAEIVDTLEASDCPLDEARAVLRAALSQYENRMEDAYQRQQERLMENGGPDDSQFRKDMHAAGRAHLLR